MATVHVTPCDDLIQHSTDTSQGDCACGPTAEHVPNPDGPDGWVLVHHSLDGRELHE